MVLALIEALIFRRVYIYIQNSIDDLLQLWMVYDVDNEFFGLYKWIQHTKYDLGLF